MIVRKQVKVFSRNSEDRTQAFPDVVRCIQAATGRGSMQDAAAVPAAAGRGNVQGAAAAPAAGGACQGASATTAAARNRFGVAAAAAAALSWNIQEAAASAALLHDAMWLGSDAAGGAVSLVIDSEIVAVERCG